MALELNESCVIRYMSATRMTAEVMRMRASEFRDFRQENAVVRYDGLRGVAWFAPEGRRMRCVDRVSLWNAGAGGVDDVLMVSADTEADAVLELERVRPR
jgi:hypothetical protein